MSLGARAALTRGANLQFDTREETLDALKAYRDKIGNVDIVRGFGWRYSAFPATGPRKEDLDAIWPDVPAVFVTPASASACELTHAQCTSSFGTDWPAAGYYSTFRPREAIEIAITRRELDKPNGPQLPPVDEAIPLDVALKASTMGPAYQLGMERDVGSIEVGKLADLVVLERNLFEIPPNEIYRTKVAMTVMNGQVRYE